MRTRQEILVFSLALAALVVMPGHAWQRGLAPLSAPTRDEVERGRYLVEEVAKCAECHTRRKANGDLDEQAWLQGAPIWIRPVANIQPWADHAPGLAGLPSFTDAQVERVLERGTGPNGEPLRAPMHIYHLTQTDARAIVAYLKSLPAPMR